MFFENWIACYLNIMGLLDYNRIILCVGDVNMIYRLATESDISSLSEMRWEHEYEEEGEFDISKEDFIKECNLFIVNGIRSGTWYYWIAEENNIIISNIYINIIRKVPKPQKLFTEIGYITNVHTKIEFRNKGIGAELLKKIKQWAIDNKIELLFVWPSPKSVTFYERQGFSMNNEIMELEIWLIYYFEILSIKKYILYH